LINELKRLGAHIVFADLSRIIVCTNKFNVEDGLSYMNYLLTNLQTRDLFNTIHIETNKIWTVLLWNDAVTKYFRLLTFLSLKFLIIKRLISEALKSILKMEIRLKFLINN
jgi:hypothetical protein